MSEIKPKPPLTLLLASPRGFCAGVDRAIQIVELAIEKYGPPVYVRHEIVHNRYVVEGLERKGAAITYDELHPVVGPADPEAEEKFDLNAGAMPSELTNVDKYLKATQLAADRPRAVTV
ncbi:MAG: 4-hydroxy-3-methylbut-2-enyl diphosphate reductase, partial [Alphaproteobacteria bacterium HGW-Alphaproteobacteria-12]